MKFRLDKIRKFICRSAVFWFFCVILLASNLLPGINSVLNVLISLVSALIMFSLSRENEVINQINGVKPIWRILGLDSKIEYFSLDKSKSIVDNVEYYSIIVDENHKIQSVNKINGSSEEKLQKFYFSENGVVESGTAYLLKDSPLIPEGVSIASNAPVFQSLESYKEVNKSVEGVENFVQLNIIKSTTIFSDDTYFFEGDGLSGGTWYVKGKLKPYSGNLGKKGKIKLAGSLLKSLEAYFKDNNNHCASKKPHQLFSTRRFN